MSTPTSPTQYRMHLNNLLQANGGAGRLRWGIPVRSGPDHSPLWEISAFLDGMEYASSTWANLGLAKEEAAKKVLGRLLHN